MRLASKRRWNFRWRDFSEGKFEAREFEDSRKREREKEGEKKHSGGR